MNFLFEEILGPNKELTNIDTEIKEAEEFLSEDQISIIRSIVVGNEHFTDSRPDESQIAAAIASAEATQNNTEIGNDKWNNLKPTLRSLGLVKETPLLPPPSHEYDEEEDEDEEDDDYLSDEFDHEDFEDQDDDEPDEEDDDEGEAFSLEGKLK